MRPTWSHCTSALVLLALGGVTPTSCADSRRASPPAEAKDPCEDSKTEDELLSCRRKENAGAEDALRKLLERLSAGYEKNEPPLAKLLAAAQGKWQEYRDSECKVRVYYSASGTAHEVYWLDCLTKMNRERIEALRRLAENP